MEVDGQQPGGEAPQPLDLHPQEQHPVTNGVHHPDSELGDDLEESDAGAGAREERVVASPLASWGVWVDCERSSWPPRGAHLQLPSTKGARLHLSTGWNGWGADALRSQPDGPLAGAVPCCRRRGCRRPLRKARARPPPGPPQPRRPGPRSRSSSWCPMWRPAASSARGGPTSQRSKPTAAPACRCAPSTADRHTRGRGRQRAPARPAAQPARVPARSSARRRRLPRPCRLGGRRSRCRGGGCTGPAAPPTPPLVRPPSARVQLSRASEFYPGSPEGQDRILLVSGTVNQLLTALHLVLSKLRAEPGALRAVQVRVRAAARRARHALLHAGRVAAAAELGAASQRVPGCNRAASLPQQQRSMRCTRGRILVPAPCC